MSGAARQKKWAQRLAVASAKAAAGFRRGPKVVAVSIKERENGVRPVSRRGLASYRRLWGEGGGHE